jgi:hypothetical protein
MTALRGIRTRIWLALIRRNLLRLLEVVSPGSEISGSIVCHVGQTIQLRSYRDGAGQREYRSDFSNV